MQRRYNQQTEARGSGGSLFGFRRVASIALAAVMAFGACVPAFAQNKEEKPAPSDKAAVSDKAAEATSSPGEVERLRGEVEQLRAEIAQLRSLIVTTAKAKESAGTS